MKMMRLMNRILPTCEAVSQLTSRAMDESLSWPDKLKIKTHLAMCVWCRRNAHQIELVRNLAQKQAAAESEEAALTSEERARLSRFLEDDGDRS